MLAACEKQSVEDVRPLGTTETQNTQLPGPGATHEKVARKLAKTLANASVRNFLKAEALKKFDGDYDVLFTSLLDYAAQHPEAAELRELAAVTSRFPLLNVAVPVNIDKWDAASFTPLVAYLPDNFDEKSTAPIIAFDAAGTVHLLDSRQTPTVPVIVVSQNERTELTQGKVALKQGLIAMPAASKKVLTTNTNTNTNTNTTTNLHSGEFCGTMPFDEVLYLRGLRSNNISAIESWANGAPEIRMYIHYLDQNSNVQKVLYGGGADEGNLWKPNRRSDVDNKWWNFTDRLVRWSPAYGEILNFTYWEDDGGSIISWPIKIKGKIAGFEVTSDFTINIRDNDEKIGTFPVDRTFCANSDLRAHGNNLLKFQLDWDPF
jgi:hypothetical protein